MTFAQAFFRYYDRAIGSGTCSFSQTGIGKNDFTRLCTEPGFVLDRETILRASKAMRLMDEEVDELLKLLEEAGEDA